jgi:hypothetical protein
MRALLLGTALVAFTSIPVMAQDAATMATKMELAQEYSKLVPVDSDIEKTVEQLALQVPVSQRTQFKSILDRTIKADRLKSASEMALVDIFTAEELAALIAFYKTPEGQAIKDKMPEYQGRIQPVLEGMIKDSVNSLQSQMGDAQ